MVNHRSKKYIDCVGCGKRIKTEKAISQIDEIYCPFCGRESMSVYRNLVVAKNVKKI